MSRSLRPRRSRPNYASLFQYEDEDGDGAGPSVPRHADREDNSDNGYAEDEDGEASEEEVDELVGLDDALEDEYRDEDPELEDQAILAPGGRRGKGKAPARQPKPQPTAPPGLSRPARQMYSLPVPSVHHRHKAIPIVRREKPVERLTRPPVLFGANETVPTNSFTSDPAVTGRLNKAWGYNIGPGPLWELLEDRGWYKEAVEPEGGEEKEENRRPRVYPELIIEDSWLSLNTEEAALYLPSDPSANEPMRASPRVTCLVGPFGGQTKLDLDTFSIVNLSEYNPESRSHMFHAGAPVWGIDWCPIHPEDRPHCSYKQYLAVGPFPTPAHSPTIGIRVSRPSLACIQIWSLGPARVAQNDDGDELQGEAEDDRSEMKCEMVLCIHSGPAYELKWCPLPSHDRLSGPRTAAPRRLGLLAGTFEDGSVSIYAVPYPPDIPAAQGSPSGPKYVKISEPLLRIELEETMCWTLEWANCEVMAVGCTNGALAVYNIGDALRRARNPLEGILPTHYILAHQSAVRTLSWIRAPMLSTSKEHSMADDPAVIASGGYDGVECLTDIRELTANIMNRTRDVINSIPFSPYAGGPVTIDHENIVKSYSASPSMLGRGHTLMEPGGPVWSASASDYHPQLAVGSADGCCRTTNMLRSTRRGGSVPFLMYKVFQLDYSRKARTFRMLERFLPEEIPDRSSAAVRTRKGGPAPPAGTGAWPTEVGVVRVAWNSAGGLARAPLLASATAAGLCRVDYLDGRWMRDKMPYGGVPGIRKEGDEMDVDEEDVNGEEDGEDDGGDDGDSD